MEAPEIISSDLKPKSNVSFGFANNWLTRPFKEEEMDENLDAIKEKVLTIESKIFFNLDLGLK